MHRTERRSKATLRLMLYETVSDNETSARGVALGRHTHPSPLPQAMERNPQQRLKTQFSLSQAFIFSQLERKVPIPSESGTYRSNTR